MLGGPRIPGVRTFKEKSSKKHYSEWHEDLGKSESDYLACRVQKIASDFGKCFSQLLGVSFIGKGCVHFLPSFPNFHFHYFISYENQGGNENHKSLFDRD